MSPIASITVVWGISWTPIRQFIWNCGANPLVKVCIFFDISPTCRLDWSSNQPAKNDAVVMQAWTKRPNYLNLFTLSACSRYWALRFSTSCLTSESLIKSSHRILPVLRGKHCLNTESIRIFVLNRHVSEPTSSLLRKIPLWSINGRHADTTDTSGWWMPTESSLWAQRFHPTYDHLVKYNHSRSWIYPICSILLQEKQGSASSQSGTVTAFLQFESAKWITCDLPSSKTSSSDSLLNEQIPNVTILTRGQNESSWKKIKGMVDGNVLPLCSLQHPTYWSSTSYYAIPSGP